MPLATHGYLGVRDTPYFPSACGGYLRRQGEWEEPAERTIVRLHSGECEPEDCKPGYTVVANRLVLDHVGRSPPPAYKLRIELIHQPTPVSNAVPATDVGQHLQV